MPSAMLSILGSAYTKLLLAMSFYDIMFSLNLSVATFARPTDTSQRPYHGIAGTLLPPVYSSVNFDSAPGTTERLGLYSTKIHEVAS
jgi:hypothetical protein